MSSSVEQFAHPGSDHSHHRSNRQDASVLARRPILTAVGVGVASLAPHSFLPPEASLAFAAVLVALIAGVYFGFAVMNGSARDQFVEFKNVSLVAGKRAGFKSEGGKVEAKDPAGK